MTELSSLLPAVPLLYREETGSTNTDAREWLKRGAPHGSLVVAARQTSGRGRIGRAFCSQSGGLYMSIILPGHLPAGQVTTLCAVAVRSAVLQLTGISLDIKWVNDLMLEGRKVCGILCEGVWDTDRCLGMIAGIGLNVCQTAFPEELRAIVRALYPSGSAPCPISHFAAEIYRQIFSLLPASPAHMTEYRAHCITLHKHIQWQRDSETHTGCALDVNDDGGLMVLEDNGQQLVIAAGEVSVRPQS